MGDYANDILDIIKEMEAKEKMPPMRIPTGTVVARIEYYGFTVPNTKNGWDRWTEAARGMYGGDVWENLNARTVRDVVITNYEPYAYNDDYYFVPIKGNAKWIGYIVSKALMIKV